MIVFLIVFWTIVIIGFSLVPWMSHCSITKELEFPIGKGNFKNFKYRFGLIKDWEYNPSWKTSLFCYDRNKTSIEGFGHFQIAYIHAARFIFNEQAMLLGPIDYFRAWLLVRKKIREITKDDKKNAIKIQKWDELEAKECLNKITG